MRLTYTFGDRNVVDFIVTRLVQDYQHSLNTDDWEADLISYLRTTSLTLPGPHGFQLLISDTGYIVLCDPDGGLVCRIYRLDPHNNIKHHEVWTNPLYPEIEGTEDNAC